ncbi:MAG: 50S ribosomal protein L29 [Clostridiales bacterium]|jgi:large subunit ribosomal protein L29|nr:50S ribosomal protein L29 [Clostridiales bacterium]
MKAKDIRSKSLPDLMAEEKELMSQLFKLRFQHATNQLNNPLQLKLIRKDIARVKTVIKEKELETLKAGNN